MATAKYCSNCGSVLTVADAACPRCLLQLAERPKVTTAAPRAWSSPAPSVDEIAPDFPNLQVLELVGRGGMGFVYKARQRDLDRYVALKVLLPECSADPAFAERFEREARVLARLDHPNIVRVHDTGQSGGRYWLTMEFVDGANLRHVIKQGELASKEALAIVMQVCAALQYAHDKGVVHRDIKPENILIDLDGKVKIADFGLAKMLAHDAASVSLTRSDQALGTPQYMAPEQIRRPLEVDHRADIYSLGVVFYELLTGELPMGNFPLPSDKLGIDVRLDEVVLRSLEREPERRYQSANAVRTDVDQVSRGMAPSAGAAHKPKGGPALAFATASQAAFEHQAKHLKHKAERATERAEKHQKRGPSKVLFAVLGCGGCLMLLFLLPGFFLLGGVRMSKSQDAQMHAEAAKRAAEAESMKQHAASMPVLEPIVSSSFAKAHAEELVEFAQRYEDLESEHRTTEFDKAAQRVRVEIQSFEPQRDALKFEFSEWLTPCVTDHELTAHEAEALKRQILPYGESHRVLVIRRDAADWIVSDSSEFSVGVASQSEHRFEVLPLRYCRFVQGQLAGPMELPLLSDAK